MSIVKNLKQTTSNKTG